MKYSDKLTFVIFAFDEEARIERVVRNLRVAGAVLVVDNHSTDRTIELAKALGAEVLLNKNNGWVEDEATVDKIRAAVQTPWIYWGFTDEIVGAATLDEIVETIESGAYKIIAISRKNYYYGRFCHGAYAGFQNRIFEKHALDFAGNTIHNFGKPAVGPELICQLDADVHYVHHFISNTAKAYLRSIDTYTDIESERNPATTLGRVLLKSAKSFVGNYLLRKGYKAGKPGLFLALQMVYYQVLLDMKSYERANGLSTLAIEKRNDLMRDELLAVVERSAG